MTGEKLFMSQKASPCHRHQATGLYGIFRDMKRSQTVLAFGFVSVGIFAALSGASAQSMLPDGQGKEVVEQNCTSCHGVEVIMARRRTPDDWVEIVNRMVGNGATLTSDQYKQSVAYLQTHLASASDSRVVSSPANAASKTSLTSK